MEIYMKTAIGILAASLSLLAGAAQAANLNNNAPSKTRAQVVAELHQAQAQGLISQNKLDYPVSLPATQHKTRQQVVAELARAKAAGQLSTNRLDYHVASTTTTSTSRSEVVDQLVAYQASPPYESRVAPERGVKGKG